MAFDPDPAAAPPERIAAIDALRGFALCGILLINIVAMAGSIDWNQPLHAPDWNSPDWQAWWLSHLFVEGAMRGLFSMLFGAGMLLFLRQRDAAPEAGLGRTRLFMRRSAWLLVFGAINSTLLLWPGDILLIYGVAGFLILPFSHAGPRTLIRVGTAILASLAVWSALGAFGGPPDAATLETMRQNLAEERAARLGGYGDSLAFMWRVTLSWNLSSQFIWWVLDAAGAMLIGMALLRLGVLTGEASTALYRRLALIGFSVGVSLGLAQGWLGWTHYLDDQPLALLLSQPRRIALALGWLGAFMLVWRSPVSRRVFGPLDALGRMALTGYLGQSVICAVLFGGFGFGLWGSLNTLQLWGIALVIVAAEAALCMAWLTRFRIGPMEWLWRTATFGNAPPLRR